MHAETDDEEHGINAEASIGHRCADRFDDITSCDELVVSTREHRVPNPVASTVLIWRCAWTSRQRLIKRHTRGLKSSGVLPWSVSSVSATIGRSSAFSRTYAAGSETGLRCPVDTPDSGAAPAWITRPRRRVADARTSPAGARATRHRHAQILDVDDWVGPAALGAGHHVTEEGERSTVAYVFLGCTRERCRHARTCPPRE